jgi:hypothetical protein
MDHSRNPAFTDDRAQFYLPHGGGYKGPFRPSELYAKIQAGQLNWSDHCFREQDGAWIKLSEHPFFRHLQAEASPSPVVATPPPFKPKVTPTLKWYVFSNEVQTGPFETGAVLKGCADGTILQEAFVWNENYTEWKPIGEVDEFRNAFSAKSLQAVDRRGSKRRPLIAQVYVTNLKEVVTAICQDVSAGGMQVITEVIPGKLGETIRLNVLPPAESGLPAFVAEGEIVRLLDQKKGFSFKFTRISSEAIEAIEEYVS